MTQPQPPLEVLTEADAAQISKIAPRIYIGHVDMMAAFHKDGLRKEEEEGPALPPSRAVAYLADLQTRAESLLYDLKQAPRGVDHLLWYGGLVGLRSRFSDNIPHLQTLIEQLANAQQGVCPEDRRKVSPRRKLVDGLRSILEAEGYDVSPRRNGDLVRTLGIVLRRCGDNADPREAVRSNPPLPFDPDSADPEQCWGNAV